MRQIVVNDGILLGDRHVLEFRLTAVRELGLREVANGGFTIVSITKGALGAAVQIHVLPVKHVALARILLQHGVAARLVRLSMHLLELAGRVWHDRRLDLRHEVDAELVVIADDLSGVSAAGRGAHLGGRLGDRRDRVHRLGCLLNRLIVQLLLLVVF